MRVYCILRFAHWAGAGSLSLFTFNNHDALLYIVFVYGQSGVFFQTLDYVGPKEVVIGSDDTSYYEIPSFDFTSSAGQPVSNATMVNFFLIQKLILFSINVKTNNVIPAAKMVLYSNDP